MTNMALMLESYPQTIGPAHPGGPVPDRSPELIGAVWSTTLVALVTAILRFSVRTNYRQFGWDDGMMFMTMMCFIGWSIILTLYSVRGGNQHASDVVQTGPDNVAMVQMLNWLAQPFGIMGAAFGKVSVSALLLNIIGPAQLPWQRYYIWVVTIWLSMLVGISCSTLTFAQCSPAYALWDSRVEGRCLPPHVMSRYGQFAGIWNTFADASLAVLPGTIFWRLQCGRTKKFQLSVVFGFNIITSLCSGVKTKYLAQLSNRTDFTWATYHMLVWQTVELFFMVVCGTLPTLFPIFNWLRRRRGRPTLLTDSSVFSSRSRKARAGLRYLQQTSEDNGACGTGGGVHELESGVRVGVGAGRTTTTVEHFHTESADNLVGSGSSGSGPPAHGVRVDVKYDVQSERGSGGEYGIRRGS